MQRAHIVRAAALAAFAIVAQAKADFSGFGSFDTAVWKINQNPEDLNSGPTTFPALDMIQLTNHGDHESRSIFNTSPQNITAFTASTAQSAPPRCVSAPALRSRTTPRAPAPTAATKCSPSWAITESTTASP